MADSAPNLSQLSAKHANPPTEIFAADGSLLGYVHTNTSTSTSPRTRSRKRLEEATIAIEDRRFYQHGALDYQGILRAGVKDLLGGGNALQGASTLTMQLVNNMYLNGTSYCRRPQPEVQDHPGQAGRAAREASTTRTGSSTST